VVLFGSGVVVGGGVTVIVIVRHAQHMAQHPEEMPARATARLRRALDLTHEQADQVRGILTERQKSLMQIRTEVQPRVEAELDCVEAEISAVLTDDQRTQWHALFTRLRNKWLPPLPTTQPTSQP